MEQSQIQTGIYSDSAAIPMEMDRSIISHRMLTEAIYSLALKALASITHLEIHNSGRNSFQMAR